MCQSQVISCQFPISILPSDTSGHLSGNEKSVIKLGFEMNWRNETYFVIIQWKVRVQSLRGKMVVKKKIAEAKINRGGVHFCSGSRMMLQDRWNDTGYTKRFFIL